MRRQPLHWLAQALARARRTAAGPAAVRILAAAAAFGALIISLPTTVGLGRSSILAQTAAGVLAAAVAVYPRGRWTGAVALMCVGAWVVASVGYGDTPSLVRVGALAGLLYAMHSAAALAAVLPLDCVVPPGVLLRWVARQGVILAAGLAVGLGGLAVARQIHTVPTVAGAIVGALLAASLAGLLAWQARRAEP
jgi:hypothetical protein